MTDKPVILVIDDEPNMLWLFKQSPLGEKYTLLAAVTGEKGLQLLRKRKIDLVLLDLRLPGMNGIEVLKKIRSEQNVPPVIMMTAYATVQNAVEAMKAGAYDYIVKPFDLNEVERLIEQAFKYYAFDFEKGEDGNPAFIAESPAMQEAISLARRAAPTEVGVLLQGESGTGKEVVAHMIHQWSKRANGPFLPLNCAAVPESLLEAELFGYDAGAFTGANRNKPGRFELADKGTLFLDEIGDLPLNLQSKLLRVIEDGRVERLGSVKTIQVDVRIIAATNRNLEREIREGSFREDLYYRLAVMPIHLPPLRQRPEDIKLLLSSYVQGVASKYGFKPLVFTGETIKLLQNYSWPGNVRELKNLVERLSILHTGREVTPEDLPRNIRDEAVSPGRDLGAGLQEGKERLEKQLIIDALEKCNGNRTQAAQLLGISRRWLHQKIRNYGIE